MTHVHQIDDQGLCACGFDASPGPHVVEVAPQPSTPESIAGECDCPYPPRQGICGSCKLAAKIRARDATLTAPLRAEVERLSREISDLRKRVAGS